MAEIRRKYPGLHRAMSRTFEYPCGPVPPLQTSRMLYAGGAGGGKTDAMLRSALSYDGHVEVVTPRPTSGAIKLLASGQARRINEHAVEIVTPGYFNDPQGDAMSLYGCGDPRCPQCNPQTAAPNSVNLASMASRPWGPVTMNFDLATRDAALNAFKWSLGDLGLSKPNKEQSMSPYAQRVIADLYSLDEKDFPAISDEINRIQRPGLVNACFSLIPGPLRGPFGLICGVFFGLCPKNTPQINLCERRRREECG